MVEFRLLGPVDVIWEGRSLRLGAPKQRCVLARLLLTPGVLVSTEQLYAAVWGDVLPGAVRKAMHVYISNLRRSLPVVPDQQIHTSSGGYLIDVDRRRIDLHVFRELAEHRDSHTALESALALWQGEALTGLADCPLRQIEGTRLTEERLAVIERRATLQLEGGDTERVIPTMYEVTANYPLREPAHALLMRALAAEHRLGEGLDLYARLRERLLDDLGTEPSAALRAVHQQLLHADTGERYPARKVSPISDAGARGALSPVPAQLPPRVPVLAGRKEELMQLRRLLDQTHPEALRIGAISGYGGIGKTALSLTAAHEIADRFDGGCLFADLGGARSTPVDPSDVLAGFLRAYGMSGNRIPNRLPERTALFRSITAGRRVLLVLDDARDAEHVRPLLPGSAECAVLVTSRARLAGLDGVRSLTLGELSAADSSSLLAEQIGSDRVDAEPEAAARILRLCGGVPLAVRIVGGRLSRSSSTLEAFANRLASVHPLDELQDGDLEVRASFNLSYQRLKSEPAKAFRLLAFAGITEVTLEVAVKALSLEERNVHRRLDGLVDLHLLQEPSSGRYRYHDLIRRFATEQAEQSDPASVRAAVVCRAFTHYAERTLDALASMMPGLGVSVPPGDRPGFDDAASAVGWLAAQHVTVTDLALRVLDVATTDVLGEMVDQLAYLMLVLGNYSEVGGIWPSWEELARRLLRRAEQDGWPTVASRSRIVLAGIAARRANDAEAAAQLEPVLADALQRDDLVSYGRALAMLGFAQREAGHLEQSRATLLSALDAHRQVAYPRGYASTLVHLAELHNLRGDSDAAVRCARAAIRIEAAMEVFDPYLRMIAYVPLGQAKFDTGRRDEARTCLRYVLELERDHNSPLVRSQVLPMLTRLGELVN